LRLLFLVFSATGNTRYLAVLAPVLQHLFFGTSSPETTVRVHARELDAALGEGVQ